LGSKKEQITEFLRSCRARLTPAGVGLPEPRRRKTPGLRREDVAALAGVSVTWYTWLEQGRDIQVSADVLERISQTLELSATEREYLFRLVQNRAAPQRGFGEDAISPAVQRMLEALSTPAIVMTARWDVVAWNRMAVAVFRDYEKIPVDERNLLRILLVDDAVFEPDSEAYETMARRVLAKFRVDYSQFSGEPEFETLIRELDRDSEAFRRLWNNPEVQGYSEGYADYPQHGGLRLEHTSYIPEGAPGLRLVVYSPLDDETADRLAGIKSTLD